MKYLIVILFTLLGFGSIAQTAYPTPYTATGSPNAGTRVRGLQVIDSTFIPPAYDDTMAANNSRTSLYAGSIIRVGDLYYYRNTTATGWLLFGVSSSACQGTHLISGSVTWSGTGLVYDVTDLDYYIICTRYSASATTLTLSAADPTYDRIDVFYADVNGTVGIIAGTPSATPSPTPVDPLTQINLGFVYVPAGSLVPSCTVSTTVYNENTEWAGASNVSGIDFAYATNPYSGTVSTYIPSAVNGQYVSYQNGSVLDITDYQYLKFYIRLNAAQSPVRPFLSVSFYNGAAQITRDIFVFDGIYGFDASVTGSYQLITIPIYNILYSSSSFDKVYIEINNAPSSFQLDKIYLLSCASTPPVISNDWGTTGNAGTNAAVNYAGTSDSTDYNITTNGQLSPPRIVIPANGIQQSTDTTHKIIVRDSTTGKVYWIYQPSILADEPLQIYVSAQKNHIRADTTDATPTALVTQYDLSLVSGGSSWLLTGNAGTDTSVNFMGTTDSRDVIFKRNNIRSGILQAQNTSFGYQALKYGNTGISNDAFGASALYSLTSGTNNTSIGSSSLAALTSGTYNVGVGTVAINTATTGVRNTAIGWGSLFEGNPNYSTMAGWYSGRNIRGDYNTGMGYTVFGATFGPVQTGTQNVAMGYNSSQTILAGSYNTIVGSQSDVMTSSTDSSGAFGFKAAAASHEFALSPYFTQIKATGLTTAAGRVLTDVAGNGILTLEPASGGTAIPINEIYFGSGTSTPSSSVDLYFDGLYLTTANTVGIQSDGYINSSTDITSPKFTVSAPFVNTTPISGTGYSLTGSNASPYVDLSGTWNTSGVPTLIKANVTNTASGASSLLMDLQVGGTSKFKVDKDGVVTGVLTNATGTAASLTAGNATTLSTAREINGTSFNGSANISVDIKTKAYQALGSAILAQNVDGDLATGVSGAAMNSQRIYYTAVYLPVAATITGVKFIQITAGDYTANNYNGVGLFTYSGGTLTKVASSTDDGNIWKATSGTMSSKAFSSTYVAAAGLYFIGHMYSSSAQTTAPSLGIIGTASTINTVTDFTNSAKTSSLITGQTALPATTQAMSGLTAAATEYKVYLY